MRKPAKLWVGAVLLSTVLPVATGCRVSKSKDHDVSIETPLGAMNVKSDPSVVLGKVGLPAYPGARPISDNEDDKNSADVNFSFGNFRLQVLATGMLTSDDPASVEGFYRKALSQYSDVIACRGNRPVGNATKTGMGLTCEDDKSAKHVQVHGKDYTDADSLTLKAGSPSRQHIVALKPQGSGETRIELVSLELPHGDGD